MSRRAKPDPFRKLVALYARMDQEYSTVTATQDFSCAECPQNCCYSYFQHHTHIEWAFALKGMGLLPEDRRESYLSRARDNVAQCEAALAKGERPHVMCPVNDDGLCGLYEHRLMICRLHGVPNVLRLPDGRENRFPGCFRFEDAVAESHGLKDAPEHIIAATRHQLPFLDRTPLYRDLVALEMRFVGPKLKELARVNLTLSQMLVKEFPLDKKIEDVNG
ncbi:MAG: hypothetical protein D6E12_15940 [Desulfovibrio sp.]|nr:MAG: hypothetical protein D6E12_15940 [Desulfovibrio sp.]